MCQRNRYLNGNKTATIINIILSICKLSCKPLKIIERLTAYCQLVMCILFMPYLTLGQQNE